MNLISRLFLLVAIALLPVIAVQIYNEFDLRRSRQLEVQGQAVSLAKLAAAEQQQIVQGIRQVLVALSELPAIRAEDSNACNAYLASMKQRFPAFLTFIVTDVNGVTFCDTNLGHKTVNVATRKYFSDALKTGEFTIGDFSIGLAIPRRVIQFVLPFYRDDGRIGGVIIAPLGLAWLADYIAKKGVPPGAALAITDRNGTYLARYPDNDRFVGTTIARDRYGAMGQRAAAIDVVDVDGIERVEGHASLGPDSGGLSVSYGLDKAQAFSEIQSRTHLGIFLIVVSTTLVLVLTWLGAQRFIHRPLGRLVDAANQWRLGEYARRVDIQEKSEIGRVADAFNTMADALEHHEQELREAKEKAEQAAARITMIFESTADSVLTVDRDFRIGFFNERAKAQLGEGRELIGMKLGEAVFDPENTELAQLLGVAIEQQKPVSFERYCAHQGVWHEVNASPTSDGLAIFFRDVTEHKQALEARRQTEEKLHQSQKMESVGQLTGGVAHDFNNLLTVISGNLELIEDTKDLKRVRQFAAAARRATDRGAKLTAQLLAFSRRQKLSPKLVNANQLVLGFQGLIRQAVGEQCEIRLRIDEQLWPCNVDPSLLETALLNLALNGRDAMPDGGVLKIETQNVVVSDKTPGCLPGSYVRISVEDTGFGMLPEVRDRVFEPFFTTKEIGKGTGLGLSMVYGFVRQSGGHVTIESAPGEGTTVALYLPKAAEKADAEAEPVQAPAVSGGSERILIVEDNEDLLEVTSAMLTTFGYQVFCAQNGAEAIRIVESGQEFDLLFSDIVMPNGMSGVELARELKRRNANVKILLTSGHAGNVLERHQAAGEFPIIDKPFRLSDLVRRLQSILRAA